MLAKLMYAGNSLGEETYAQDGKMELTDEYTWIVDPIDGTYMNFLQVDLPLIKSRAIYSPSFRNMQVRKQKRAEMLNRPYVPV